MRLSEKARAVIGAVAPIIGTALGGPLGAAAGVALAKGLGVKEEQLEDTILGASPETLATLKQIDNQFKLDMERIGIDIEKVHAEDRANARLRETTVKDDTPRFLAVCYLMLFLIVLTMQFWVIIGEIDVKEGALRVLDGLTGILGTLVTGSKDYYFGSSAGSKAKTELMAK